MTNSLGGFLDRFDLIADLFIGFDHPGGIELLQQGLAIPGEPPGRLSQNAGPWPSAQPFGSLNRRTSWPGRSGCSPAKRKDCLRNPPTDCTGPAQSRCRRQEHFPVYRFAMDVIQPIIMKTQGMKSSLLPEYGCHWLYSPFCCRAPFIKGNRRGRGRVQGTPRSWPWEWTRHCRASVNQGPDLPCPARGRKLPGRKNWRSDGLKRPGATTGRSPPQVIQGRPRIKVGR